MKELSTTGVFLPDIYVYPHRKEFLLLEEYKAEYLNRKVNKYISEGWDLYGNPICTVSQYRPYFCQALVRYVRINDDKKIPPPPLDEQGVSKV